MSNESDRFFGKYRGTVINNVDPMKMGRIQVQTPDVTGVLPSTWAMPCFPFTGLQSGIFVLPQIGAGVWVEFEQGDPDYPIWSGCWFGSGAEVPAAAQATVPPLSAVTIQTTNQNAILISDNPGPAGGIVLKTTTGAMISINDTGIVISNGKGAVINMVGNSVDVNAGALTII